MLFASACTFNGVPVPGSGDGQTDVDAGRQDPGADAAAGDDAEADSDDDSINDDVDNCVGVPNPLQHDEDSDQVGDVYCPHLANRDQADDSESTPDGVGNACDPNPNGADVLFFDGFNELNSEWTLGGGWQVIGGQLRQTVFGQTSIASFSLPAFSSLGYAVTSATMSAVDDDPMTSLRLAGIAAPRNRALGVGNGCALHYETANASTSLAAFYYDEQGFWSIADSASSFDFSGPKLISALNTGSEVRCATDDANAIETAPTQGSEVGLYTLSTRARFDWFFAVTPAAL